MRAFRFRLRTLQRLREQKRDAAKQRLADAQSQRVKVESDIRDIHDELQGLESHMRQAVNSQQLDVDRVMDGHRHQISLQAKLAELNKVLATANDVVDKCRLKLVEADREVKVLEKLHERQLSEHEKQIAAHESKLLDEAASVRAARQTKTA